MAVSSSWLTQRRADSTGLSALGSAVAEKRKLAAQKFKDTPDAGRQIATKAAKTCIGIAKQVLAQEVGVTVISKFVDNGQLRQEDDVCNGPMIMQFSVGLCFGKQFGTV